jgi:hypothetical protein
MSVNDDILTVDNLLHSLVAVVFVAAGWALGVFVLPMIGVTLFVENIWHGTFAYAIGAGLGLYLREASQVEWDWTLRWSFHKHMEWIIGFLAAFVAAFIMVVV